MDNKQNRQFYWEVKDFFAGKALNESKKPVSKPNILRDIKNVMNSSKPLSEMEKREAFKGYAQISKEVQNKTSQMLNAYSEKMQAQKPFSKGNAANYTTNMFNLNEQLASLSMNPISSSLSRNKKGFELETTYQPSDQSTSANQSQTELQSSYSFRDLNLNFGQLPRKNIIQGVKPTVSEPDESDVLKSPTIDSEKRMYSDVSKENLVNNLTNEMQKKQSSFSENPINKNQLNPNKKSSFRV
jgi:hypothetical protein